MGFIHYLSPYKIQLLCDLFLSAFMGKPILIDPKSLRSYLVVHSTKLGSTAS